LVSLDFTFKDVPFNKTMITQGGQVIILDTGYTYFMVSFAGGNFQKTGVENLTFGFGGPDVLVYITNSGIFGSGVFKVNH